MRRWFVFAVVAPSAPQTPAAASPPIKRFHLEKDMNYTRRSLALLFPAMATAQQRSQPAAEKGVLPSKAYPFEQPHWPADLDNQVVPDPDRRYSFRIPGGSTR